MATGAFVTGLRPKSDRCSGYLLSRKILEFGDLDKYLSNQHDLSGLTRTRSITAAQLVGSVFYDQGPRNMRLIIAILLPFLVFFTIGRPFQGIFCLLLQITLIGWIPAAIWAVYALSQYNTDKKIAEMQRSQHH
ncbi:YqaE/Pmp3 family membrane protein [Roseibium sp.]|uniref:YqaE/Pmp3 family membrane protein n=1 Tax=Roseibium sp. TaxID=1936156 RepID=UPI00262099B0|nr:YqaE/Pmp3 family membrane protein [Roseibium sp.]